MAESYNRFSVTSARPVWKEIQRLVPLVHDMRILDLGCGPGTHAVRLARAVRNSGSVVGIDAAKGMIEFARRRTDARGLRNLRFERMDARRLRFPSGSFDFVLSTFGLPYIGRRDSLREAFRVLDSGGTFLITSWTGPNPESRAFLAELTQLRAERPSSPEARRLAEARQKMTDQPENRAEGSKGRLTRELREVGFRKVRRVESEVTVRFRSAASYVHYKAIWGEYARDLSRLTPREWRSFVRRVAERIGWPVGGRSPSVTWRLAFTLASRI
jgi:ubiquinone/menaquinone biosynthesis C-methylase UbiE